MKKILTILFLAFAFVLNAQEYRVSFSDTKQPPLEKKQGGVLLRINSVPVNSSWQCDEFWFAINTKECDVEKFIKKEFPSAKLTAILKEYNEKVVVDTTISGELRYKTQDELNKKLIKAIERLDNEKAEKDIIIGVMERDK